MLAHYFIIVYTLSSFDFLSNDYWFLHLTLHCELCSLLIQYYNLAHCFLLLYTYEVHLMVCFRLLILPSHVTKCKHFHDWHFHCREALVSTYKVKLEHRILWRKASCFSVSVLFVTYSRMNEFISLICVCVYTYTQIFCRINLWLISQTYLNCVC
jgi:hypothetical protein